MATFHRIVGPTLALLASHSLAQTGISLTDKWSWGENIGWMNWRDAGDGSQGVVREGDFLGGYIWSENVGWISLGDGSPANGSSYGNIEGADCGVNIEPATGHLFGYAWGENIGWINFSGGALANPPQPARIDLSSARLRGFAWAENIGWINLDDDVHFVAFECRADLNSDGVLNFFDVQQFLGLFSAHDPRADFNGDGAFDFFDVQSFLQAFSVGCP